MVATQNESKDTSSNKEEEGKTTILCLMVLEDEVSSESNLEFIFDELDIAFYVLLAKFTELGVKN